MKTTKILTCLAAFAWLTCIVLTGHADDPTVSNIQLHQRWPWSPLVDVDYTLTSDNTQPVDIALTGYNGATPIDLPGASLSGDLFRQTNGTHRIVWDPEATSYTNQGALSKFKVGLTPSITPLYMIVDLTKDAADINQIEYITESDLAGGAYGSVQTNPVTGVQSIIWTDVTNHTEYMTTKLVMRRVLSGSYTMGTKPVTLTKDFYIGVFEVTQAQWTNVMNSSWWANTYFTNPDYRATRPAESITYNNIRGATNDTSAINWPLTGYSVNPSSFMGKLRARTDTDTFDLPTEAQWEYACKAGTTTMFNDGDGTASTSAPNDITNQWLNALGRYLYNGGKVDGATPDRNCTTETGSDTVGSYLPNAWGLYDMHGNLLELCLDWYATSEGGTDPLGTTSGTRRLRRGGSWSHLPGNCRSYDRMHWDPATSANWLGFRIVKTLP